MPAIDPIEFFGKLRQAPMDSLVESLRRLHQSGIADPSLNPLLNRADAAQSQPPAEESDNDPAQSNDVRYEKLKRHFVRHAQQLRQQGLLTEQLLEGFARDSERAGPETLQHEIRIALSAGTRSVAQFKVVNSLGRSVDLRFREGRIHGLPTELEQSLRIEFVPARPFLGVGDERIVEVRVDLQADTRWPEKLQLGVDILGEELLLMKLWLLLEIHPEVAP